MRLSFRIFCFILIPLICLPIALVKITKPFLCFYMLVILAAFWSLDVLPYGITSLIPILFAPLMSIQTSEVISKSYSSDSLILCLGRLILACAYQRHQIHRRFSLFLLTKFGPQPRMIILSCMLPCYILTMFISNTATAPIMLEFVIEILQELRKIEEGEELEETENKIYNDYGSTDRTPILSQRQFEDYKSALTINDDFPSMTNVIETVKIISDRKLSESIRETGEKSDKFKRFSLALSLSTGYAASSGAVATLVASGPNLVALGVLAQENKSKNFNYGTFMMVGLPLSIVTFILTWLWVGAFNIGMREFFGYRQNTPKEERFIEKVKNSYEKLGKITFSEMSCIGLTVFVIIMWISRSINGHGWGCAFPINASIPKCESPQYVSDATPMVLVIILLFIWPTKWDFWRKVDSDEPGYERLLTWEWTNKNLPWAIVFLLGIAFAVTEICRKSEFKDVIGNQTAKILSKKNHIDQFAVVPIVATLACVSTELLSSTTLLPVLVSLFIDVAEKVKIPCFYFVFPLTLCSSFAFCLPAATTPNIAIFNRGLATTKEMIKTGILMDIVFIFITSGFTYAIVFNFEWKT